MPLPAPQALAALARTPAGWGHHTSKTVICPHTSAQTVSRLAMSLGSWETFSEGWLQKCIFSLSTWLRTIYCLQTIHEPACVILTLFQFFYVCLAILTFLNWKLIPNYQINHDILKINYEYTRCGIFRYISGVITIISKWTTAHCVCWIR